MTKSRLEVMYGTVAIMWLIPDRRIETLMKDQ